MMEEFNKILEQQTQGEETFNKITIDESETDISKIKNKIFSKSQEEKEKEKIANSSDKSKSPAKKSKKKKK
jgi:hypothetical protein